MKKFLLLSFVLLSASGILFAKNKEKKTIKPTKEIRQVVLVQFKESVTAKEKAEIGVLAQKLKAKSRTLQKLDWGKPLEVTGNDAGNYDFCLTFKFKNDTNYEIFQQNPLRLEFWGKLIPLTKNMVTFTYRINE